MAAGGSSPELFASGMGTFLRSSVGFGAIVGSAVFNVLFVVGVCAIIVKEPMQLTWYPMMRDSTYYCIVLIVLAIFVGVTTPQYIIWWEALILHLMYYLYVYIMSRNSDIFKYIKSRVSKSTESDGLAKNANSNDNGNGNVVELFESENPPPFVRTLSTLHYLRSLKPITAHRVTHAVVSLAAEIGELFETFSSRKDNSVDIDEFKRMLESLNCIVDDEQVRGIFATLDSDDNKFVTIEEFTKWYAKSKERLDAEIEKCFDKIDSNNDGVLNQEEVKKLVKILTMRQSNNEHINNVISELFDAENSSVSREAFHAWFLKSPLHNELLRLNEEEEEEMEGISIYPPEEKTLYTMFWYIVTLPQVICFYFTIPDVRKPGNAKYVFISFVACLAWFGVFSYFMVRAVQIIGATIGIPSFLMGLTFLAAGTSVPDMLSAVIVANNGEGDKAVSSSIGSNVFDICVGLALPWLLFWMTYQEHVYINADGVGLAIGILIVCLVVMIGTLWYRNWLLPKSSGIFFVVVYFAYVALQCAIANWGDC